jgi:SpoVK/Ycf46/Vps4 family AAA+-type ATPase
VQHLGDLGELDARCRHRERLLDRLGRRFGASANRGVRALFTGTSGTGKTLAARILGAALDLDVYRVDLAAVINKYIGETEKNLHRILSRAEALDVVLLLDEGDALLGSRTEVRSANDRYANLETNYLLQRLETYQGIVVVTTNLGDNIDSAFQRRMDVVVPFFAPKPEERWHILDRHLPPGHEVSGALLSRVASLCQLTGGQLRNAALHAALLALQDDGRPVGTRHLEEAVRSEYRKAGAAYPLARDGFADGSEGMSAFIASLGAGPPDGGGRG